MKRRVNLLVTMACCIEIMEPVLPIVLGVPEEPQE